MVKLKILLNIEKEKLNRLIAMNNDGLLNDIILEQSRRVDKIIAIYIKLEFIKNKGYSEYIKYNKNDMLKEVN